MAQAPAHVPHTVDQRRNRDGFPKAGEVIEMKPSRELSLQESRVFNLLFENAGENAVSEDWHEIAIGKLRGDHKGSERVHNVIKNLMVTLVEFPTKDKNGLPAIQTTALLSDNVATIDETDSRAVLRYRFTETMRDIIKQSRYWGRLKGYVIFAFSSKYALALYEAGCLRVNRQSDEEFFTTKEFRRLMGVPEGKYPGFSQFKQWVIDPAILEINGLSELMMQIEPVREGGFVRGKLKGFKLRWRKKEKEEWYAAIDELNRPRTGRKQRLQGTVEQVII